jgi:glycosyltransferase involved in cell wall biosynthesis
MKLSVIVPAYNEEKLIEKCLKSIRSALSANAHDGLEIELIVVDNNSSDRTAEIARECGAHVVFEPVNQISRARNAGAGVATGEWFLFIDADSYPSAGLMGDVIALLDNEHVVGCGSKVSMRPLPIYGHILVAIWHALSLLCRWAAGSFVLCRAEAFRELDGFSENLYATEEIDFSIRLRKWGRPRGMKFKILRRHPLETSNRKMALYGWKGFVRVFYHLILHPRKALQDPNSLPMWYDGKR